jgi:GNAT superfamily N-acetyltransferase
MSMAYKGRHDGLDVSRGATDDLDGVFIEAARMTMEGPYVLCLLDRVRAGELGVYVLSARCRTIGAICYKVLDGDAELIFGHAIDGGAEAFFFEGVVRGLFESGAHTVRSNFNWPEPDAFVRAALAMGFTVTERMSMCRCTAPISYDAPPGFRVLAWQDGLAGGVCRVMCDAQAPADRAVYPMFGLPEGARMLMESILQDRHGKFLRELSYVATSGEMPVGFLISTLLPDGSVLILDIGVDPGCRRLGIGGAMLDRLIGDSYASGYGLIVLAVTSNNYEAIRLYRRKGFSVNGHFMQYVLSRTS